MEINSTGRQIGKVRLSAAIDEAAHELVIASRLHGPFNSAHEGYAVIKEELEELWEAIKVNNATARHKEAVQLAAMALRFLMDCCP